MVNATGPIGVFDSGIGGLSVLYTIHKELPDESLLYLADSHYAPYGKRTDDFISMRSTILAEWLFNEGVKLLVIACNTATAQTLELLQSHLQIPIIGVEPNIQLAIKSSQVRRIGVLATAATIRSIRFQNLLKIFNKDYTFICVPGTGLVEIIEAGITDGNYLHKLLSICLQPMKAINVDTIVLGCTHYPFIRRAIQAQVGKNVTLIENNITIIQQLKNILSNNNLYMPSGIHRKIRLISTNDGAILIKIAKILLKINTLNVERVNIMNE